MHDCRLERITEHIFTGLPRGLLVLWPITQQEDAAISHWHSVDFMGNMPAINQTLILNRPDLR